MLALGAAQRVLDFAVDFGEEGMVAPHAYVVPGMHDRAALPHEDLACVDPHAAVGLDAEPYGLRVAALTGASACFLVCHAVTLAPRCRRCAVRCRTAGGPATSWRACDGHSLRWS